MKRRGRKILIVFGVVFACIAVVGVALGVGIWSFAQDVYFANKADNVNFQQQHLGYLKNDFYAHYTPKGEQTFCDFDLKDALDRGVKFNEVAFLATHNSYQRLITDDTLRLQTPFNVMSLGITTATAFRKNDFENDTLTEQFERGIRSIELDVEARVEDGKTSFVVMHKVFLDSASTCIDFAGALEEIALWSDHNPNHLPITILIESKQSLPKIDGIEAFDMDHASAFDNLLREVLGDKLFTPAQMLGSYPTFKDLRADNGWKPLNELLGKVIVVLHESDFAKDYMKADDTMRSQAMFVSVLYKDRDLSQASFIIENDPEDAINRKEFYRTAGFMVRTRADAYPKFSDERYALTEHCLSQIITTDFCPRTVRTGQHTYTFNGFTVKMIWASFVARE